MPDPAPSCHRHVDLRHSTWGRRTEMTGVTNLWTTRSGRQICGQFRARAVAAGGHGRARRCRRGSGGVGEPPAVGAAWQMAYGIAPPSHRRPIRQAAHPPEPTPEPRTADPAGGPPTGTRPRATNGRSGRQPTHRNPPPSHERPIRQAAHPPEPTPEPQTAEPAGSPRTHQARPGRRVRRVRTAWAPRGRSGRSPRWRRRGR